MQENADRSYPRPDPGTITYLLDQAREGDDKALAEVWTHLYQELRRVAHNLMRGDGLERQVDATELIGEIWMRGHKDRDLPTDRNEFFGRAFRHMSQELIHLARLRDARKRGGGWSRRNFDVATGELAAIDDFGTDKRTEAAELMAHWEDLHRANPVRGNITFCRLVLGLSNAETATTLAVSEKRARQDWDYAKAKLRRAMTMSHHDEA